MANYRKAAGSRKIIKDCWAPYGGSPMPDEGEAPTLDAHTLEAAADAAKANDADAADAEADADGEAPTADWHPTLDPDYRTPEGPPPGVGVIGTQEPSDAELAAMADEGAQQEKDRSESVNTIIAFIRSGAHDGVYYGPGLDQSYTEARDAIDRYVAKFTDGYK